jgi:hypothetical protein
VRVTRLIALAAARLLTGAATLAAEPADPGAIAVVVGAKSAVESVTLDTLRELYLRRRRVWPDGRRADPVNLPADSPVRERFSKRVLGRGPQDLGSYWDRRWFEGIRPPLVLQTAEAVCAYVGVEPHAIGYLPLAGVDPALCRVVLVLPATPAR